MQKSMQNVRRLVIDKVNNQNAKITLSLSELTKGMEAVVAEEVYLVLILNGFVKPTERKDFLSDYLSKLAKERTLYSMHVKVHGDLKRLLRDSVKKVERESIKKEEKVYL